MSTQWVVVELAQIVGDSDCRIVMRTTDFGTHGDCYDEDECYLQVDARGLLGACLEVDKDEHADALEPIYFISTYLRPSHTRITMFSGRVVWAPPTT